MSTPVLSQETLDEVLQAINIPACPAVVTEVLREAQKDDPQMRVLSSILSADVSMSATAIKLANSAMFRSNIAAKNVSQAVNRIGINNILSVVIAVALRKTCSALPAELMERFWSRASHLAVSTAAIARKMIGVSADSAYTYALFRDAAIPVMMSHFPGYAAVYTQALETGQPLAPVEFEHFQCSHAIVGWLLTRNWGLPPKIVAAIRFHHDEDLFRLKDESMTPEARTLIAVTLIAEHLLADVIGDADAELGILLPQAMAYLGTSESDMDEYREAVAAAVA